jgi:2'-5' RNA ligase
MSDAIRLFVACELSREVKETLTHVQGELKGYGLQCLRWVRPDGIHLTLKFLGETPPGRAPAIQGALAAACQGTAPFGLSLGKLGTFGDRRGPRVIWVDIAAEREAVAHLQERVEERLERLGFPRERRTFSPHLTLARVSPELAASQGPRIREALAAVTVPEVRQRVAEVSLMRSILQRGGAAYERLAASALA